MPSLWDRAKLPKHIPATNAATKPPPSTALAAA